MHKSCVCTIYIFAGTTQWPQLYCITLCIISCCDLHHTLCIIPSWHWSCGAACALSPPCTEALQTPACPAELEQQHYVEGLHQQQPPPFSSGTNGPHTHVGAFTGVGTGTGTGPGTGTETTGTSTSTRTGGDTGTETSTGTTQFLYIHVYSIIAPRERVAGQLPPTFSSGINEPLRLASHTSHPLTLSATRSLLFTFFLFFYYFHCFLFYLFTLHWDCLQCL